MNIVITGHVDHGKSSLIGRILFDTGSIPESLVEEIRRISQEKGEDMQFAYFLDALEEERTQNITIDTTQTFFKTEKRPYIIIDAPGHREFLKNMVSGASLADAAVLIVDISRGIEEQTRRHANILKLLGLTDVIVAVNKMDMVNYDQEKFIAITREIQDFFKKLKLTPKRIIPISAKTGENILKSSQNLSWYQGLTLLQELDSLEEPLDMSTKDTRISIQGIYPKNGENILLARIESGEVKMGDNFEVYPGNNKVKIKTIKNGFSEPMTANTGQSVGLILSDKSDIDRGAVLSNGKAPHQTSQLRTTIFSMTEKTIPADKELILKCGTQEVKSRIKKVYSRVDSSTLEVKSEDTDRLEGTEVGDVDIETDSPVVFENFNSVPGLGRIVLVENDEILAAGIING
jgi:small GTP-binding protein